MKINKALDIIESWMPKEIAEDFDNVGLLIGDPSKELRNIDFPINNWIYETNSFKTSFSRFANSSSLNIFDKISFRSGLQYCSYTLGNNEKVIQQYGCSIGSGYKFKSAGNQIDLNFCFGYREYPINSSRELYQQLQMSISLADVWFIKRRQK